MIWIISLLFIALIYVAEYFREKAALWEKEAGRWRNEAVLLDEKISRLGHEEDWNRARRHN